MRYNLHGIIEINLNYTNQRTNASQMIIFKIFPTFKHNTTKAFIFKVTGPTEFVLSQLHKISLFSLYMFRISKKSSDWCSDVQRVFV